MNQSGLFLIIIASSLLLFLLCLVVSFVIIFIMICFDCKDKAFHIISVGLISVSGIIPIVVLMLLLIHFFG